MSERYGASVHWLESAPHRARPPVPGDLDVDVVVLGGGFTGLWTAHHLLAAAPDARVAVLEREEIGFGASGRNGGFAMTVLDLSLAHLRHNQGDAAARAAHEAVAASVREIGETVAQHGIDCDWVHGGLLVVATNAAQQAKVDADLDAAEALGLSGFHRRSAAEVRARVASPTYVGGLEEEHCAVCHPAKLVRGLADVVEAQGGRVFENSGLLRLDEDGARLRITTPGGVVRTDQLVLATNAWASSTPWFRNRVMPLYTYVLLTEPLSPARWAEVGWDGWQGVEDKRNFIHYYRPTADGRILWGWGAGIVRHPTHRIRPEHDADDPTFARMAATFRATFPQLADVAFTHRWGGPTGITPNLLPMFGTLADRRIHYGLGYNGHGVAPSHLGGKVLRDKVLGTRSEVADLCFVDPPEASFPPDPLRWLGAALTRRAMIRQDERFDRGATVDPEGAVRAPLLVRLADRLG